jgi:hypothetical protein
MDQTDESTKQPKPHVHKEYEDPHFHDEDPEPSEEGERKPRAPQHKPARRIPPPPRRRPVDD